MPVVTVNPINSISVKVLTGASTFNNASANIQNEIQNVSNTANAAYLTANAAYLTANAAYALANTGSSNNKVSKTGDTMSNALYFQAVANTNPLAVGPIQSRTGIDLYASNGTSWAQLNYGNTNFIRVNAQGSYLSTPNTSINATDSTGVVEIIGKINTVDQVLDGGSFL